MCIRDSIWSVGWLEAKEQDGASYAEQLPINQHHGLISAHPIGFDECSVLAATIDNGDRIVTFVNGDLGMQFRDRTIRCKMCIRDSP